MAKGQNSILFDIDSIIDKEGSIIKASRDIYLSLPDDCEEKEYMKNSYVIDALEKITDENIKNARINILNPFKLLLSDSYKPNWKFIMEKTYETRKKEILDQYVLTTEMVPLIKVYRAAGKGVITSTIRIDPDDDITKEYIENILPGTPIISSNREDVDLDKYGRIVTGSTRSMLQYKIEDPKSLLILSYRENYLKDDDKVLDPELIVNLGDINEIRITSPYKNHITQ